nr:MAG TPA: hypothetical protein [Caudoviricetes sp.]
MKTVKTIDKLDLDKIESIIKEMSKSLSDRAVVINVIIANNQMLNDSQVITDSPYANMNVCE